MRVVKFYTFKAEGKVQPLETYVWYIEDKLKQSQIVAKIEKFLRQNKLICYMSTYELFASAMEYDLQIRDQLHSSKKKRSLL